MKQNGLDLDHDSGYYGYGISIGTPELTLENVVQSYQHFLPLSEANNFLLYAMLSDEKNRAKTFGMTSILNTSIPFAVKTGTSTDFRDNWAVGYNPDAIIGVWVGNADGTRMEDISGVSGAGPIWHHIAEYMIAHGFIENTLLVPPTGIIESYTCLNTSCTRKEKTYIHENHTIQSRPLDSLYWKSDFIISLTEEEIKKWKIR